MTSVTSFLRQVDTANQFVGAGALASLSSLAYEFVPTTANYVGNYPPGAMVSATATTTSNIQGQIAGAISAGQGNPNAVPILRDMGKTVYAGIASSEANALTGSGVTAYGWFRQYQLLLLNPITNNNFINGTTFGVAGVNASGYTPYLTFYLPSAVAGIFPVASATSSVLSQATGGQL